MARLINVKVGALKEEARNLLIETLLVISQHHSIRNGEYREPLSHILVFIAARAEPQKKGNPKYLSPKGHCHD